MPNGRLFLPWLAPGLLAAIAGCAGTGGPLLSQRTTVGSLKAGMSRFDFENQQLKKQVAELRTQNRQVEDQLVQEESANGDLQRRLDDARNLLAQNSPGGAEGEPNGLGSGARALPAAQSSRRRRKAPFAQIPGRIDADDPSDDILAPGWNAPARNSGRDLGPQSRLGDPTQWLPVASGVTEPSPTRR